MRLHQPRPSKRYHFRRLPLPTEWRKQLLQKEGQEIRTSGTVECVYQRVAAFEYVDEMSNVKYFLSDSYLIHLLGCSAHRNESSGNPKTDAQSLWKWWKRLWRLSFLSIRYLSLKFHILKKWTALLPRRACQLTKRRHKHQNSTWSNGLGTLMLGIHGNHTITFPTRLIPCTHEVTTIWHVEQLISEWNETQKKNRQAEKQI